MADKALPVGAEFVGSVLEDNNRLRSELDAAKQALSKEKAIHATTKREAMRDIYILVEKLGGEVVLSYRSDRLAHKETRLFMNEVMDGVQYRIAEIDEVPLYATVVD